MWGSIFSIIRFKNLNKIVLASSDAARVLEIRLWPFLSIPLFVWSGNRRQHTRRNRRGLLLFVLWLQGDFTPQNHPSPKILPLGAWRFDKLLLDFIAAVAQKPFFYFWQCPIFSSSAHRVVHFPFVTYFVFVLFFIAIFIYFYVFIIWPVLEFCRAQNWDALRGGWGAFDRL